MLQVRQLVPAGVVSQMTDMFFSAVGDRRCCDDASSVNREGDVRGIIARGDVTAGRE